ncbi:MAG TPA: Holliday junction resolvase RuvX [Anaerolineae bacterium]
MARVLALDIGEKRIGVAVSDESQRLARPLATIVRASKREDFEEVARLIAEYDAERLIVGLPKTLRGEEGPQAQRVRRYADALSAAISVPVFFQDERYTSVEAEERLKEAPRKRRAKGAIDAAAAAIILQDYLNQRQTNDE